MAFLLEAEVEGALLEQLHSLGYAIEREEDIGPDGVRPARASHDEAVLKKRFEDALARLNPGLPLEARQEAVRRVTQSALPSLLEENRRLHRLITERVDVEYYAEDGTLTAGRVRLIDFDQAESNDWLAVSQFVVICGQNKQRADVVVFVNSLPLGCDRLQGTGQQRGRASAGCIQRDLRSTEADSSIVQHQRAAGYLGWHFCSRAVVSTEIVDILMAADLKTPDISGSSSTSCCSGEF